MKKIILLGFLIVPFLAQANVYPCPEGYVYGESSLSLLTVQDFKEKAGSFILVATHDLILTSQNSSNEFPSFGVITNTEENIYKLPKGHYLVTGFDEEKSTNKKFVTPLLNFENGSKTTLRGFSLPLLNVKNYPKPHLELLKSLANHDGIEICVKEEFNQILQSRKVSAESKSKPK